MKNLELYRDEIDKIDKELSDLLDQRFKVSTKVGKYKKKKNIEVMNLKREQDVLKNIEDFSYEYNKEIIKIYNRILEVSKECQK